MVGGDLVVETLQPVGSPSSASLEEHESQCRVALENAQTDELGAGEHLLEGVRAGVEHEDIRRRAVRSERGNGVLESFVDGHGHP